MGDLQVNGVQGNGFSNVNQIPQYPQNKIPEHQIDGNIFEENLRKAQSNIEEKQPSIQEENLEWPQIRSRSGSVQRPQSLDRATEESIEQVPEDKTIRSWPAPYNASRYRAKTIREYREMQAKFDQRMPKTKQGDPDVPAYTPAESRGLNAVQLYKQDQLFNIPGGDFYFLKPDGSMEYNPNYDHSNFEDRVGKDLEDAVANVQCAMDNIGEGAKYTYVDAEGKMQTAQKTGLFKTLKNFVQNVVDGLNGGKENQENAPEGTLQKIGYAGKKIFIDGLVKNIILGVPQAMLNIGENLFAATINAMEAVPDATIGTTEIGRKLTTTVFDNAQVSLSYITDVMPTGEAWLRVHAAGSKDDGFKLPYLYNLKTPQQGLEDMRWAHVRNTPFRKVIETVGCIFSDILTFDGLPIVSLEPEIQNPNDQTATDK